MPCCGKALTAKAEAKAFEVPLLRLDMGRLMGKYIGESESNFGLKKWKKHLPELRAAALKLLLVYSAVCFLMWMKEKDLSAFVVATANNIDTLLPELLRKGHFDETFYVDLPNESERKKILEIHVKKRRKVDVDKINFDQLVKKTEGYRVSYLEGVVREGIENAFVRKQTEISTSDIITAIEYTHSLSEVMKDSIKGMKKI